MGVESFSGFESGYESRPPSVEIEGKVETAITEVAFGEATHIPLFDITWPGTRVALKFSSVGIYHIPVRFFGTVPAQVYTATLEYPDITGEMLEKDFTTEITTRKRCLFTGTGEGFYAYDPAVKGMGDDPYIIGLQPYELEENMRRLAAVYHELGHALIFDHRYDTRLVQAASRRNASDLPNVAQAIQYAKEVLKIGGSKLDKNLQIDSVALADLERSIRGLGGVMSLFHERNAWAAGAWLASDRHLPTGYEKRESFYEYARLCLSTYAKHHGDDKFVRGFRREK